jgi:hypothetical protein
MNAFKKIGNAIKPSPLEKKWALKKI